MKRYDTEFMPHVGTISKDSLKNGQNFCQGPFLRESFKTVPTHGINTVSSRFILYDIKSDMIKDRGRPAFKKIKWIIGSVTNYSEAFLSLSCHKQSLNWY